MEKTFIIDGVRTPIGDFMGSLSALSNIELGTIAVKELLRRVNAPAEAIDEVACGMIYKAGSKGNPGRQIQLAAGLPDKGYACTVDQQCGSAMRAAEIVSQQIATGKTGLGIAVGVESMSNAAYVVNNARKIRMGDVSMCDTLTNDGLTCAICNYHMGVTAENLAEKYGLSRTEQDELAVLSHQRARAAQEAGRFDAEIVPVTITSRKGDTVVAKDEHPRDIDLESLRKLKPAFKKDGTVTAGNASGINDGAAAVLLASEEAVNQYALKPKARLLATASVGVEPALMGIGPVYAIPKALKYAGLSIKDIGCFEINEAFAAQFLACNRELNIPMDILNANGSGIALGHPVGATGVRIIVSLISEMQRCGVKFGVASLCVGGGPAMAAVVELL